MKGKSTPYDLEAVRLNRVEDEDLKEKRVALNFERVQEIVSDSVANNPFFQHLPVGLALFDGRGNFITANPKMADIFGVESPEDMRNISLFNHLHFSREKIEAAKLPKISEYFQEIDFCKLKERGVLYSSRRNDIAYLQISIIPWPVDGGQEVVYLAQIVEVSERFKLRSKLEEEERLFKTMVENSFLGLVVADDQFRFTYVNPKIEEYTGYSENELLGQKISKVLAPDSEKVVFERYRKRQNEEFAPSIYDFKIKRKDGALRAMKLYASLFKGVDGKPKTMAHVMDVTEQQSQERYLKLLAALVEQAPEGIIVMNREGIVEYVNPAFEKISGYSRKQIIGKHAKEYFTNGENGSVFEEIMDTVLGGKSWSSVLINDRKDGSTYYEENMLLPIHDEKGEVLKIAAFKKDITEKKELEKQFFHAQKLEAIGKLAGGIAHDLNNILTVITGYSQFLLAEVEEGDPIYEDIQEIYNASTRGTQIIGQILAFSRKQVQKLEILNLSHEVAQLEKMLRRLIGEDIQLITVFKSEESLVKADRAQVQQVIMNIVVNARDAMPDGGEIIIEVDHVALGEDYISRHPGVKPGDYVRLCITDNGIGMDKETQSRIFDPFFTTKESGKGTGLGLSTVYGIVQQSHGYIEVYSEPNRGTTFKIYLPRLMDESSKIQPNRDEESQTEEAKSTILLVEDEETLRNMIGRLLRERGHRVLEADNPGESFLLFEKYSSEIDLVLTDMVMPLMDGKEMISRLKKQKPDLKVVYMSGYTENAVNHFDCLDKEAFFLQKPFTPGEVVRAIKKVLESEK